MRQKCVNVSSGNFGINLLFAQDKRVRSMLTEWWRLSHCVSPRLTSKLRNDTRNTARRLDSDTGSGSPRTRTSTIRYWPSRIQPLKWPIFEQNPSTFGWDMTQNGNKVETRCFGSYLSQILMDFASIWIILKVESCWTAQILYRIVI